MQTTYSGEHSIIFGDKHSWEDWGLVPTSLPIVSMPSVNTNMLEIPGMSGKLDLTDVPLGYPTYSTRNGSWTFYVAHDITGLTWEQTYAMISSYLHGRRRKCILLDDRSYYYIGRFSINQFKSDKLCSQITINYELDPFKWMRWSTCDDWPWNPFDFIYGEITQDYFKDITVTQRYTDIWTQNEIGSAPVVPVFTVAGYPTEGHYVTIEVSNSINNSSHSVDVSLEHNMRVVVEDPLLELSCPNPEDTTTITIKNHGYQGVFVAYVSIDFTPGRL